MALKSPTPYHTLGSLAPVGDVQLNYVLEGDPHKPLLALIPMARHNLTMWERLMPDLLSQFRVLRFDLRGMGRSTGGAPEGYCFEQYADDLAGLLTHCELGSAIVVGVAYGARTAAAFALRHPGRLAGLALFDVSLTPPVDQRRQGVLGEAARAALAAAGQSPAPAERYWRFYEDRESADAMHRAHEGAPDLTEPLGAVQAPTLIACGAYDENLKEAQRIAAWVPPARFHLMPMTGHGSPVYRPAYVAALLAAHFGRPAPDLP